ncbi:MAG TPA: hypothetical protein VMB84_02670 [Stellaceae bacterium]|nr:hypothetical protein [Stellaceae bacterium]
MAFRLSRQCGPAQCARAAARPAAALAAIVAICAPAVAADGVYRGKLNCAAIPTLTIAPVTVDFTMIVRGASASYQRPVLSYDGHATVGQETGTGTVSADGTIVLQGGINGRLGAFSARYAGRLNGTHVELSGIENFTAPRQYERSCSISLDAG